MSGVWVMTICDCVFAVDNSDDLPVSVIIIVAVVCGVIVIILSIILIILCYRRQKAKSKWPATVPMYTPIQKKNWTARGLLVWLSNSHQMWDRATCCLAWDEGSARGENKSACEFHGRYCDFDVTLAHFLLAEKYEEASRWEISEHFAYMDLFLVDLVAVTS